MIWDTKKYGWDVVYYVKIEGIPVIWIESATSQSLPAGYTQDATLVVDRSAEVGQLIDRDRGIGAGFPFTFQLIDPSTTVRAWLKKWALQATLTANLTYNGGTVTVDSTSGWPAAGSFYIGLERISYTGKTATTFTGCTRGEAGSIGSIHNKGPQGGIVTDLPRWWRGRQVRLFAAPVDPSGYMTGAALEDEAVEVWRGILDAGPYRTAEGMFEFEAQALDRRLDVEIAPPITGKVVDASARFPIKKSASLWISAVGMSAVGVKLWEFAITIHPYGGTAYADDDMLTSAEQAAAIIAAFNTAIPQAINQVSGLTNGATYIDKLLIYQQANDIPQAKVKAGTWACLLYFKIDAATKVMQFARKINGVDLGGKGAITFQSNGGNLGVADWLGVFVSPGNLLAEAVGVGAAYPKQGIEPSSASGVTVELDDTTDSIPATGTIKIGDAAWFDYETVATAGSIAYFGKLKKSATAAPVNLAKLVGQQVLVLFRVQASYANAMRQILASSGAGNRGSYDVLGLGQGYALDGGTGATSAFDPLSFASLANGPLVDLSANIAGAGRSFAEIFGGVLALAQRAVVARLDSSNKVRIGLVSTDPGGSNWQVKITDNDLLSLQSEPVEIERRRAVPNTLRAQLDTGEESAPTATYTAKDVPAIAEQGAVVVEWKVPTPPGKKLTDKFMQWTAGRFAASQVAQCATFRVVPWLDVKPGDLIRVEVTHPALWQWSSGTPGYTGQARVLGVKRKLDTGGQLITALLDGHHVTRSLSPAGEVQSFDGPAAAPTAIYLEQRFFSHFNKTKTEAVGTFRTIHYQPGGGAEGGGGGYVINAVTDTGSACKLTVDSVIGGAVLDTTKKSTITLPVTADSTTYQQGFAHRDDGSAWV